MKVVQNRPHPGSMGTDSIIEGSMGFSPTRTDPEADHATFSAPRRKGSSRLLEKKAISSPGPVQNIVTF